MSPQENVSDPAPVPGAKSPFSPVCAEVRVVMDAVRDGRATPAERTFVAAHTQYCAECASDWAFLRATKAAWARTPTEIPSASLSARIAAMTYRKPTFAQRVASAFAFLNPIPVRVAIGVAAVAGLSFFVLPRIAVVPDSAEPIVTDSVPSIAREVPTTEAKPTPSAVIATAPVRATSVPAPRQADPKPITSPAQEAPVVASKSASPEANNPRVVAVIERPAPKVTPRVSSSLKPVQVAITTPKPVRETPSVPVESTPPDVAPPVAESENRIVAAATPAPSMPGATPEPKSPVVTPSVTVAGRTAPESDPDFSDRDNGPVRINLENTGKLLPGKWSGKAVRTSSATDATYIVSAETKL